MKIKIILLKSMLQSGDLTAEQLFMAVTKAVCRTVSLEEAKKVLENALAYIHFDGESEKQLREEIAADLKLLEVIDNRLSSWWKRCLFGKDDLLESKQNIVEKEMTLSKVIELAYYIYVENKLAVVTTKHEFELDFNRFLRRIREADIIET